MPPSSRPSAPRTVAVLRRLTATVSTSLLAVTVLAGGHPTDGADRATGPAADSATTVPVRLAAATTGDRVQEALRTARRQKGDPYRYGAEGPKRFDCSGLVWFATHRAGFDDVPRTSAEQGEYMRHIKKKKLRRGDFVFFTGSSGVYHVGIYVGRRDGDRAVLHAPSPGTKVRVEEIWTDSWFAATLRD